MTLTDPGSRPPSPGSPPDIAPMTPSPGFAGFFKRFMIVAAVSFAALPIPVTGARLIPAFKSHQGILLIATPLICLLSFSTIFFWRHSLARRMSPLGESYGNRLINRSLPAVPPVLIALTIACIALYYARLSDSIGRIRMNRNNFTIDAATILDGTSFDLVPDGPWIIILYIFIFMLSGSAVVFIALQEYLQDSRRPDNPALIDSGDSRSGKPLKTGWDADDA
jgi:hypothetical protein